MEEPVIVFDDFGATQGLHFVQAQPIRLFPYPYWHQNQSSLMISAPVFRVPVLRA